MDTKAFEAAQIVNEVRDEGKGGQVGESLVRSPQRLESPKAHQKTVR